MPTGNPNPNPRANLEPNPNPIVRKLASFLAYINNIIEIHTDAFKMVVTQRRNFAVSARDIGCFGAIFNAITVIGIISNCGIMLFVNNNSGTATTAAAGPGALSVGGSGSGPAAVSIGWETVLNLGCFESICLFFFLEHVMFGCRCLDAPLVALPPLLSSITMI